MIFLTQLIRGEPTKFVVTFTLGNLLALGRCVGIPPTCLFFVFLLLNFFVHATFVHVVIYCFLPILFGHHGHSTFFMSGPVAQCKKMFESDRIVATCMYLLMIVVTVVVAFTVRPRAVSASIHVGIFVFMLFSNMIDWLYPSTRPPSSSQRPLSHKQVGKVGWVILCLILEVLAAIWYALRYEPDVTQKANWIVGAEIEKHMCVAC